MSNASSFLSTLGGRLKSFFSKFLPIAQQVTAAAVKAAPIVDLALAGAGHSEAASLYNTVSASVLAAETTALAAASQNGTGVQKAAAVLSDPTVQSAFSKFESAVGVQPHSTDQQLQYVNAVVTTLNTLNGSPVAGLNIPAQPVGPAQPSTGKTT